MVPSVTDSPSFGIFSSKTDIFNTPPIPSSS
jgi:hypothetical protein